MRSWCPLVVLAALGLPSFGSAETTYTDCAVFQSASAGLAHGTLDWEAIPAGSALHAGGLTQTATPTPFGVVFPASLPDVMGGTALGLEVAGLTIAGSHVLGTDDAANYHSILGGSHLELGFTVPLRGVCIEILSADTPGTTLRNGDLELALGTTVVSLDVDERSWIGSAARVGGGSQDVYAYQLGVITDQPFEVADLRTGTGVPGGAFNFVIDEIVLVPEPGKSASLAAGCAGLAWLARRSRGRQERRHDL